MGFLLAIMVLSFGIGIILPLGWHIIGDIAGGRYTYLPPLTSYELFMICFFLVGVALVVLGAFLTYSSYQRNRRKHSQELARRAAVGQLTCTGCGINVSPGCMRCPACKQELAAPTGQQNINQQ